MKNFGVYYDREPHKNEKTSLNPAFEIGHFSLFQFFVTCLKQSQNSFKPPI